MQRRITYEMELSGEQKRMFWVSKWKQPIFTFRITSNKTKFPLRLSEFRFIFTAVKCSHIFIACAKTVWGWVTGCTSRSVRVLYRMYITKCDDGVQGVHQKSDCTLINSSSWEIKIFLHLVDCSTFKHIAVKIVFVFIINNCVDCFILALNVRKHNGISSVCYATISKTCIVFIATENSLNVREFSVVLWFFCFNCKY